MFKKQANDIPEMVFVSLVFYHFIPTFKLKNSPSMAIQWNVTATLILIVGLVYQVVLGIWNPTGLQYIVDELLHTVIPLFMLGYWFLPQKR
jgi:hypothetical protein